MQVPSEVQNTGGKYQTIKMHGNLRIARGYMRVNIVKHPVVKGPRDGVKRRLGFYKEVLQEMIGNTILLDLMVTMKATKNGHSSTGPMASAGPAR